MNRREQITLNELNEMSVRMKCLILCTIGAQWTFVFKAQSYSLTQLAQDGLLNQTDARLLYELGERVRTLLHSYFRSPSELFVSFTHLVCRSAIAGTCPYITWRAGRVCEPEWVSFLPAFR